MSVFIQPARWFVGLCLVGLAAACALPPKPSTTGVAPKAVIKLEDYVAGLKVTMLDVAGEELPFIVDTGGGLMVINPDVAEKGGCEPFGQLVGYRSKGDKVVMSRCNGIRFSVNGWSYDGEVGVFDLGPLLQGAPPVDGKPVAGLLGLAPFDGQAVTVDHAGNRLVIESPLSLAERIMDMSELHMRRSSQAGGASLDVMIAVEAAGGSLWMSLDSGNTGPVMMPSHAFVQLGLEIPEEVAPVDLPVAGLGPVDVAARNVSLIYDGLLNAAFVGSYRITLDLVADRAWAVAIEP